MQFVEVLKECESASGAGSKQVIRNALLKLNLDGRRLMRYAQDPYLVFGVKAFDQPCTFAERDPHDLLPAFATLDDLAERRLTGHAARAAVTNLLGAFTQETASYLERIIDKDLAAGFSAETFNKVWPGDRIPVFDVMLADKCEDAEDFEIAFPCLAEQKLDGERTIAVVRGADITYYSRSGKEAKHVDGLFDEELLRIREHLGFDFVLDGERYASNFTETVNAKKAGNDGAKANLKLHAFFLMPLDDWIAQRTEITMRQNRERLTALLVQLGCQKVIATVGREVVDYQDMMAYCNEAIDRHGVEGLILKAYDSVYAWKRTLAWCKIKRFYDVDCRIVGFYSGKPKSRLERTLGGVRVVGFLEDGTRVEANVGSGFSDVLRDEIWQNQERWLRVPSVVIKYQDVTRSKSKDVASLRFPTFERARDDKLVEV